MTTAISLQSTTLTLRRSKYQNGSLTTEKRSSGPAVWVFRWRESSGVQTTHRKRIVGTVQEFRSETAARKAVDALKLDINAESIGSSTVTMNELATHYKEKELCEGCGKSAKTRETYRQHLDDYILPRWGRERIADIRAFRIEDWLAGLNKANGTKAKTKAVLSVLYQHAMRYGWATRNPMREVRQSSKRLREPDILTPEEVVSLLEVMPLYARTMVLVAAVTGLRRGELTGLQWQDVDFSNGLIHIRRSLVDMVAGEPKTEASKRPIPLEPALASALQTWQEQTRYAKPGDWLFASPYDNGANPYWPSTVMQKIVQPSARHAGITKSVGWHTFRRCVATWLLANGETVKTTQDLLRHASPMMTLGTYAQAITADKRLAQGRIATLLGMAEAPEKLPVPA